MQHLEQTTPKGIPEHATLVFKGVLFDTWQWEQELFDGSFTTFEAVVRKGSTQLICVVEEKLLLYEEEQPIRGKFISLPGGHLDDADETPLTGAKRELLEEMGMEGDFELMMETKLFSNIIWPTYYYIVKNCKIIQEHQREAGEKINPILLSFDEFILYTQREDFRNKEFQKYIKELINRDNLNELKEKLGF